MEKYLPYPQCRFSFDTNTPGSPSSLADIQAIFALAQQRSIDLRLFISPSHARQWETLAAANLWSDWENWKRQLVTINAQEAARAGRQPLPLWDFSGYDAVSTESLPEPGNPNLMTGYTDSSHYSLQVGQRLVMRIFAGDDNWGVNLVTANLEKNLAQIRAARQTYRASHQVEVAEIVALAAETSRVKHCAKQP